jgi:2-polyprenyl-3-methyl-5-hydroxy-6-metoxy-1,4-benzoquinol methylase
MRKSDEQQRIYLRDDLMVSERHAAQFFDGFAEAFDTIYDNKRNLFMRWVDRRFRSDMFIRFALTFEAFGDLTEKSVLDIGCGSGPYVLEALNRGARHVTAVDPAPNMLALVRQRLERAGLADRCSVVVGLFPGVDVTTHDHAMILGVMDYVADAKAFLDALPPLVNISAVISFPSKHWFRTPFRKYRYRLRKCPVFFYDEEEIRALCSAAGFGSIEIHKIPGAGMDYHVCLKH